MAGKAKYLNNERPAGPLFDWARRWAQSLAKAHRCRGRALAGLDRLVVDLDIGNLLMAGSARQRLGAKGLI
jgi:hypothetical protein